MKIKTIRSRLDNAGDFDKEVNAALADGWRLVKREYINPISQGARNYTYIMLYAELVKDDPPKEAAPAPKEITWQEAVRALVGSTPAGSCRECKLQKVCVGNFKKCPENWEVPADE